MSLANRSLNLDSLLIAARIASPPESSSNRKLSLPSVQELFRLELQLTAPVSKKIAPLRLRQFASYPSPNDRRPSLPQFQLPMRIHTNIGNDFPLEKSSEDNHIRRRQSIDSFNITPPGEFSPGINSLNLQGGLTYSFRKVRKRTTEPQLKALTALFELNPNPSQSDRIKLSAEIQMSPRAIQVWFQNKRQQVRK